MAQREPESAITPEMRRRIGVEGPPRTSPPVDRTLMRIWAIAISWPEPPDRLFVDEEYAKTTRFGGIIAPPYFNPFAYAVDEARLSGSGRSGVGGAGQAEEGQDQASRAPGGNAGGEAEYFGVPIRPGDVITARSKAADIYERAGRSGRTLFTVTETTWRNQRGELVRIYRGTGFRLLGRG